MEWRKPLLIGMGWGLGTALGLVILVGGILWYESRPKPPTPPKPWDSNSIKAQYDFVNTEGDKNTIVFFYTVENMTDFDYRVEDDHNITMNAKLQSQNDLSPLGENGKVDYPIYVPAKKRVQFQIHISYAYPEKAKPNANTEERRQYRADVEKYVGNELANLDGFDFLDEENRYEIIFPVPWKHSQ
jgi:hypothetical protein